MTSTELVTVEAQPRAALTIFGTDDPSAIVRRVSDIAGPLAAFIKRQQMTSTISGREYVLAEGWSFMGAMLGVSPVATRVSEVRDPEGALLGFEAHVELRTRDGAVVGGAIAECSWAERNWSDRDPFALKSMAQTRATGKAYRMAFGFVMKAAGYEATPAEEMSVVIDSPRREPGSTVAGVTPPQARTGKPHPFADDLKAAMDEAQVTFEHIEAYLGVRPTNQAIADWLTTNKASVNDLVALAVPAEAEPAGLPF